MTEHSQHRNTHPLPPGSWGPHEHLYPIGFSIPFRAAMPSSSAVKKEGSVSGEHGLEHSELSGKGRERPIYAEYEELPDSTKISIEAWPPNGFRAYLVGLYMDADFGSYLIEDLRTRTGALPIFHGPLDAGIYRPRLSTQDPGADYPRYVKIYNGGVFGENDPLLMTVARQSFSAQHSRLNGFFMVALSGLGSPYRGSRKPVNAWW